MAKVHTLTAENLAVNEPEHGVGKRLSIYGKDSKDSDGRATLTTNPNIRRMSRLEGRPSVQYNRRMSIMSRTSITGSSFANKNIGLYPLKLQNTYKLQPDSNERFRPGNVHDVIKEVLEECLDGEKYNPTQCRQLSQMLTDLIKTRVKDMGFLRYKYIVTVTIGQDTKQGVQVLSRCLWNKDTDNYAEAHFTKDGLFAVATVYACYCD